MTDVLTDAVHIPPIEARYSPDIPGKEGRYGR